MHYTAHSPTGATGDFYALPLAANTLAINDFNANGFNGL
jgi:hypothetical protein